MNSMASPMRDAIRRQLETMIAEAPALESELSQPDLVGTPSYVELAQRYAKLRSLSEEYHQLCDLERQVEEAEAWLAESPEEEMAELIREELAENQQALERLTTQVEAAIIPEDPSEERSAIIEIRGGTGGEESALFAADLFRMYLRFAEQKGFRTELMDSHPTSLGGFKTVIFSVNGRGAYRLYRFESGVHRVQRVPETETSGRIHTSTATVAVLAEAEAVDVDLREEDLEIEAFRSSGPGGQNVNKVNSAVRIKHLPSGVVVSCQEERSQHKNKERAMRLLRAKLKDQLETEAKAERVHERRIQIGSAERSEKIRTYNFPQNRISDHRIELTLYQLDRVLEGELDLLIEPLTQAYQEEQLAELVGS